MNFYSEDDLRGKTMVQLKSLAKEENLRGFSSLRKEELVQFLLNAQRPKIADLADNLVKNYDTNHNTKIKRNALAYAVGLAGDSWKEVVKYLLDTSYVGKINYIDKSGISALKEAISRDDDLKDYYGGMTDILLSRGADPNIIKLETLTQMDPIFIIKFLDAGANPKLNSYDLSRFVFASANLPLIKRLIKTGVNLNEFLDKYESSEEHITLLDKINIRADWDSEVKLIKDYLISIGAKTASELEAVPSSSQILIRPDLSSSVASTSQRTVQPILPPSTVCPASTDSSSSSLFQFKLIPGVKITNKTKVLCHQGIFIGSKFDFEGFKTVEPNDEQEAMQILSKIDTDYHKWNNIDVTIINLWQVIEDDQSEAKLIFDMLFNSREPSIDFLTMEDVFEVYYCGREITVLQPQGYTLAILSKGSDTVSPNCENGRLTIGNFYKDNGFAVTGSGADRWIKVTPKLYHSIKDNVLQYYWFTM